jgi:hypothetical protein
VPPAGVPASGMPAVMIAGKTAAPGKTATAAIVHGAPKCLRKPIVPHVNP